MSKKVLVLSHQAVELPDTTEGLSDTEIAPWKTEFDVVNALKDLGHETQLMGGIEEIASLRTRLYEWKADIVFNLLEEFQGEGFYVPFVLGYLRLLGIPFTGCNPSSLTVSDNKPLAKKILRYHRIPTPDFLLYPRGRKIRPPSKLDYPIIVKSATEHGSVGISQASVVTSDEKLADRVAFVHEQIGTDAIAEQFIPGREIYVGIIGNSRLTTLVPRELKFENLAGSARRIATEKVKWDINYQEKRGIVSEPALDIPPAMADKMARISKRVFRILGLSGYARMDFRVAESGEVYLLEPNPNPDLALDEDFARAAADSGIVYEKLIARILKLGFDQAAG